MIFLHYKNGVYTISKNKSNSTPPTPRQHWYYMKYIIYDVPRKLRNRNQYLLIVFG